MIGRRWRIALSLNLLAGVVHGATIELVPMVGFQFNGNKDLAGPRNNRLDFQSKPLTGLSIGYLTKEDGEVELSWTHSNGGVDVQRAGGFAADHLDVAIDQFHFNGLYMTDSEPLEPFVLMGLGATLFTPSGDRTSATRFSIALGGGFKWLWNDHIGLRFDGRWTPALVLPGSSFFCDKNGAGGCYTTEGNSYLSRAVPILNSFEFTSGLMLRY